MKEVVGGGRGFEGEAESSWAAKAVEGADEDVDGRHVC